MNEMAPSRDRAALAMLTAMMLGAMACSTSSSTSSATPTTPSVAAPASAVGTSVGLYAVDVDTGETTLFLGSPEGGSEFAITAGGDLVAFEAEDGDGHPQIFVINADGTDLRQMTHELYAQSPSWSPDGARIAFHGIAPDSSHEIYVVDVASGESSRITRQRQDVAPPYPLSWSSDGQTIAFQVGDPPVVRTVDVATGFTTTIAKDAGIPDLSPDGSRLAFNTWSMAKVTLVDIDGSDRTIIRTHSEMYNAKWSPNGQRIAFQSYPLSEVNVYELATGGRRRVPASGDIVDWLDDQTLLVLM